MSNKSQKKIDVHKFITEIYNPSLNDFIIHISDELSMGHIIYEGRTIYRKNLPNLTPEGVFLDTFRDELFHFGASHPDQLVDSDQFTAALEPLFNYYQKHSDSKSANKIATVLRSADELLATDYFQNKIQNMPPKDFFKKLRPMNISPKKTRAVSRKNEKVSPTSPPKDKAKQTPDIPPLYQTEFPDDPEPKQENEEVFPTTPPKDIEKPVPDIYPIEPEKIPDDPQPDRPEKNSAPVKYIAIGIIIALIAFGAYSLILNPVVMLTPTGSLTMNLGQTQTFTVTSSGGTGSRTYQWYLDGAIVTGKTATTYIYSPATSGSHTVYCKTIDSIFSLLTAQSNTVSVTVNTALSVRVTPTGPLSMNVDQTQIFTATPTGGTGSRTYQWYLDGVIVIGQTASTYTYTAALGTHMVYIRVTDGTSAPWTTQSNTVRVTVNPVPTPTPMPITGLDEQTAINDYSGFYASLWEYQTFYASSSYTLKSVSLPLWRLGYPGTFMVSIRAVDSSHTPIGPDLSVGTFNGNLLTDSNSGTWYSIALSSVSLSSGREYAIICRAPSGSANDAVRWQANNNSTYLGQAGKSDDNGTTWTQYTRAGWDYAFKTKD